MTSLLGLSEDALALAALLDEHAEAHCGDITDIEAQIDQWASELGLATDAKLEAICRLVLEAEARAGARAIEASRLTAYAAHDMGRARRLRDYVQRCAQLAGWKRHSAGTYQVSIVRNGGKAPLLLDSSDPQSFPAQYRRRIEEIELDREAIRAALEAGREVPGARLGERGSRLAIR